MPDHLFIGIVFFVWIILVMVGYAYHIVKLRWHLEEKYPTQLERLDFGKKISRLCYYTTPRQGKNVMKFIHSAENFNDPQIKVRKSWLRLTIKLAILWLVALIIVAVALTPK